MRFAIALLLISLLFVILGLPLWLPMAIVFWWTAAAFAAMGLAYLGLGPGLLGKQPDGSMSLLSVLFLLPFLLFTWGIWHLNRRLSSEDAWNEVAPGLYLGRRAFEGELPADVKIVVDLTSEFHEPRAVRESKDYRCFAVLDGYAPPSDGETLSAIKTLARDDRGIYVHCAAGHGRSSAFLAAVILQRGLETGVDDVVARLRDARPGVALNGTQLAWVKATTGRLLREEGD